MIPLSASVVLLLIVAGPWSMFAVSRTDQLNRLETVLVDNQILVNGKIQEAPENEVTGEEAKQISRLVEYLRENHGAESLRHLYTEADWNQINPEKGYTYTTQLLEPMGVNYVGRWTEYTEPGQEIKGIYFSLYSYGEKESLDIAGYEDYLEISLRNTNDAGWQPQNSEVQIRWANKEQTVLRLRKLGIGGSIEIDLEPKVLELVQQDRLHSGNNQLLAEDENYLVKLFIEDVSGYKRSGEITEISRLNGVLLVKEK